jgi:hypothetical protein
MATGPQPPRPPAPPQPQHSRSNLIVIALLIFALILVVGGIGMLAGLGFLAHAVHVHVEREGARKQVSIQTPVGSLQVNKDAEADEVSLGLPIYPGATRVKDHDSAAVNFNFGGETKLQVLAGRFQTPDSLDKVTAFYHDRLGNEVTKFKERDAKGETVFEIKKDKQDRVVSLKTENGNTVIELVRVGAGESEAN